VSLRAELVRFALRQLVKRRAAGGTVDGARRDIAALEAFIPSPPAGTETTAVRIGGVNASRITTPRSLPDRIILHLHGGAFVIGSPSSYRHVTWRMASAACACVVSIDYRLAPEHPFPAALEDAVAAYRSLIADGVDPRHIAVIGDSAGGGLAFAMLLKLRDDGVALPAAAVALSPWTDLALAGPSVHLHADADPMANVEQIAKAAEHYLAGTDPRTPYASPLYGDPAGLPPTLLQVGSDEVLRDDAVRMADRLQAAGCRVELEVWPRMPHAWHLFAPLLPEADRAIERVGAFVRGEIEAQAIGGSRHQGRSRSSAGAVI
jgi:monoterpene epsilon-lactone hydrolase